MYLNKSLLGIKQDVTNMQVRRSQGRPKENQRFKKLMKQRCAQRLLRSKNQINEKRIIETKEMKTLEQFKQPWLLK